MTKLYLVSYDPVGVIPGVGRHINPGHGFVVGGLAGVCTAPPPSLLQQWLFATLGEAKACAERLCLESRTAYIVAELTEIGRFAPIKPVWSGVPS